MKPSIGIGLGCLMCTSVALAAAIAQKPGSEVWTKLCGSIGAHKQEVLTSSRYHALRGVKLWDYDRRTCVLEFEQSSLNKPSRAPAGTVRACEPRVSQSWKAADVGDSRYITAIEACTADGPGALLGIRGLRIWGSTLDDVRVDKPSTEIKLELSDCKRWRGKVACPEGTVATGIRVHYSDHPTGVSGLELRCHALVRENDQS